MMSLMADISFTSFRHYVCFLSSTSGLFGDFFHLDKHLQPLQPTASYHIYLSSPWNGLLYSIFPLLVPERSLFVLLCLDIPNFLDSIWSGVRFLVIFIHIGHNYGPLAWSLVYDGTTIIWSRQSLYLLLPMTLHLLLVSV